MNLSVYRQEVSEYPLCGRGFAFMPSFSGAPGFGHCVRQNARFDSIESSLEQGACPKFALCQVHHAHQYCYNNNINNNNNRQAFDRMHQGCF